jgi:Transglycosylase SLT domain
MGRIFSALVSLVLVLGACSSNDPQPAGSQDASPDAGAESSAVADIGKENEPVENFGLPLGDVPGSAAGIAKTFAVLQPRLLAVIDRWVRAGGDLDSELGRAVSHASLLRQKIFRTLSKDERLEKRVLAKLPPRLDQRIRIHTSASRALSTLVAPVSGPIKLPTTQPDPPQRLKRFFKQGEEAFDVPWELLASVNLVETRFGRLTGPSTAGAQGPMQFIPSTWATYGRGDVNDPHDAILGAARYLQASGAPADLRSAVYSYNHADAYVKAILTYYDEMRRDPRNYYSYYFWQVFVRTTKGDVQLTGPGGRRPNIR